MVGNVHNVTPTKKSWHGSAPLFGNGRIVKDPSQVSDACGSKDCLSGVRWWCSSDGSVAVSVRVRVEAVLVKLVLMVLVVVWCLW